MSECIQTLKQDPAKCTSGIWQPDNDIDHWCCKPYRHDDEHRCNCGLDW